MDPLFHFVGDLWQLLAAYIWQNACQLQPLFCLELHKGTTFFFFFFCSFFFLARPKCANDSLFMEHVNQSANWKAYFRSSVLLIKVVVYRKRTHSSHLHVVYVHSKASESLKSSTRKGFLWIMLRCLYKNNQKNNNEYLSYPPPPPPACMCACMSGHACMCTCMHACAYVSLCVSLSVPILKVSSPSLLHLSFREWQILVSETKTQQQMGEETHRE